jgi:ammonium transporter, Amt family
MPAGLSETSAALCIFFIALVPLAIAGITFVNAGLGRGRSAAHLMLTSLCVLCVAASVYVICGFAWQGYIGGSAREILVAGKRWNWLGRESFFLRNIELDGSAISLAVWLQMFGVALAAIIPLGAGLDRWKLSACCASTALLAGCTYPVFAHWAWSGGWLAQLGQNAGLGQGFVDAGGAGSIQVVGGLTALAMAWILGPRRGKYSPEGMPSAIPGHNSVIVLAGCFLALLGWLGLNSAGAILFVGAAPGRVVQIGINTVLAASSGCLMAAFLTRVRFGRPDVSICANGWVSGLVASSAGGVFFAPAAAILVGLVAGFLVTYSVEWFELYCGVDDPGGAVSVHAVGGLWGLLAVGFLARFTGPVLNVAGGLSRTSEIQNSGQWLAQIVGIATLLGFVLPLTYGLNFALNLFLPHRVVTEGERQGLDLYELGAGAYPELVTHSEEFTQS